jgi:hypothetical protein
MVETLKMTWTGITPLVMSNVRMADPFGEHSVKLSELTSIPQKSRTKEQQFEIFYAQWEGYLYYNKNDGPVVPGQNIEACLREGAAKLKMKKDILERLEIDEVSVPLEYKGPRDLASLWKTFRDIRIAGKSGSSKRSVCRPIFAPPWSLTFTVLLDDVKSTQVLGSAEQAGRFVGLCTHRCFKWGRFTAKWTN